MRRLHADRLAGHQQAPGRVARDPRSAVEAAIAETGFQPSAVARSLVQRRSQTLGVIVAGLRYFGVAQTLNGITEESQAAGYGVLLREIDSIETVDIVPVIEFLIAHRVEGIIFAAPQLGDEHRDGPRAAADRVAADRLPEVRAVAGVLDDRHRQLRRRPAWRREHLLALGRRRIGHLAGPLLWREAQDRRDGWRDALRGGRRRARTDGRGQLVAGQRRDRASSELLALDPDARRAVRRPTTRWRSASCARRTPRGIAIPDDLAVVGFDGLDEGAQFTPSLTTVVQPLRELGELAVREVLCAIGQPRRRRRSRSEPDAHDRAGHPRERAAPIRRVAARPSVGAAQRPLRSMRVVARRCGPCDSTLSGTTRPVDLRPGRRPPSSTSASPPAGVTGT